MPRTTSSAESVDTRNLAEFVVVLTGLALGFTAVTRVAGVDIVAVGALYMFTPGVAGLVVCLHNGIAPSDVGLTGRLIPHSFGITALKESRTIYWRRNAWRRGSEQR